MKKVNYSRHAILIYGPDLSSARLNCVIIIVEFRIANNKYHL